MVYPQPPRQCRTVCRHGCADVAIGAKTLNHVASPDPVKVKTVMRLVGQYDSPFVRRAAIALHHHGIAFERHVISTFAHLDENLTINPLGKVPTLILTDGTPVFDSRSIVEYLESNADADVRLTVPDKAGYVDMLQMEAVGIGLAEKTYERGIEFARRTPGTQDMAWVERLERQIGSSLAWLESRCRSGFLVSDRLSRADLAVATAATFVSEKQPQLYDRDQVRELERHRLFCESLPPFRAAAYSKSEATATGWRPEA